MEDWLAQLDMDIKADTTLVDNPPHHQQYQQSETMEAWLYYEQLAATLGEDFPCPLLGEGDTPSPQWEFDYNVTSALSEQHVSNNGGDHNYIVSSNFDGRNQELHDNKEETKKQAMSSGGGAKRKRHPSQVQEHVLAERKRRELLSQMFISLSAIVPGLKKMDKTSVLGEAIKYMKQLQEKVKVLEEMTAKRTVESMMVLRKSQLIVDDDTVSHHFPSGSGSGSGSGGSSREVDYLNYSIPEIEVKLSGEALLLRIYYEEQNEILPVLLAELNRHGMSATNCSVIPFDNSAFDISIAAQMIERGFSFNVKDFIRSLLCAMRLASHKCHNASIWY